MNEATEHIRSSRHETGVMLSRRRLVEMAGVTLIGTAFLTLAGWKPFGEAPKKAPKLAGCAWMRGDA